MPVDENGDWIDEESSPYDNFPASPYTGQAVAEMMPPPDEQAPPELAPMPAQAYGGQAFPGLPVIVDKGSGPGGADQFTYNGQIVPNEQAAFAARSADAANPASQAAYQAAQAARPQPQPGDQDAGEMTSIQLRAEMDKNTLSRADQLELTQLQNGVARVQADAREGRLPTAEAIRIERELRARMQPRMITLQQFHGLQQALDYKLKEERFQQLSRQGVHDEQFRAQSGLGPITRQVNGQTFLQTERGRWQHIQPDAMQRTAAPRAAGSGGGSGGGDHFEQHYRMAADALKARLADPDLPPEEKARLMTAEGGQAFILRQTERMDQTHRSLAESNFSARTLSPGGPIPGDPRGPNETSLTPQRRVELGLRGMIEEAENNGQSEASARWRQTFGALRAVGGDTGRLSDADQRRLKEIGYYQGGFTPDLDRQLSFAARPIPGPTVVGPDGTRQVTMVPNERMQKAAEDFRASLIHNRGQRPTTPQARIEFDELRGRLGIGGDPTTWPPPAAPASNAPPAPIAAPRPSPYAPHPQSRAAQFAAQQATIAQTPAPPIPVPVPGTLDPYAPHPLSRAGIRLRQEAEARRLAAGS